jgi:acetyl-CoA carboxylase biotin carboxyl carrier protein
MVSNSGSGSGDIFDVRKVRRFIELMNEYDLTEIDLRQADQRIRLRRGPEVITVAGAAPTMASAASDSSQPKTGHEASAASAPPAAEDANAIVIRSPMVGTFYTAASPDSPDQVGPESTVCIVEAMKVFNEIPAVCSGKIVAVLATNGASVEYGQPLFRVAPNV